MCNNHQNHDRHGSKLEHGEAHTHDHENWSRRTFLSTLGLASLGSTMMLGGMPVQAFSNSNLLRKLGSLNTNRVLVLIQMNGGNDGLNTIIPVEDSIYYNNRPTIGIRKEDAILLDDLTGLHPAMASLEGLWNNDSMTVVQSVGYDNQSRSHFEGTDIWTSGRDRNQMLNTGWMGRYLTETNPNFLGEPTPYPLGVRIGGTNLLFQSDFGNLGMTFGGNSQFEAFLDQGGFYDEDSVPNNAFGKALGFTRKVTNASFRYVEAVQNAADGVDNLAAYPQSNLGRGLSNIAKLIRGDLQTKIYLVSKGGFDTHSNQGGIEGGHAGDLGDIANSVTAFYEDLAADGLADDVLTMTFSEFGRTLRENDSQGTDHGSAAPLFLFGPSVRQGIYGNAPDLGTLQSGEPIHSTDYRTVYSTVLRSWFGLEDAMSADILGDDFDQFDFIEALPTNIDSLRDEVARTFKLNQNYPNPFNPTTIISFSLPQASDVRLRVFDSAGRLVQTLVNSTISAGNHEIFFSGTGLNSGVYFYTLDTQFGTQTKKMTLIK